MSMINTGDILDVDVQLTAQGSHFGDHADGIVSDNGDKSFHNSIPRFPMVQSRLRGGILPFQYSRFADF